MLRLVFPKSVVRLTVVVNVAGVMASNRFALSLVCIIIFLFVGAVCESLYLLAHS